MPDEAGVLDVGLDFDSGPETTTPEPAQPNTPVTPGTGPEQKPQPDEFKDDKEYRAAIKAWRDQVKDNPALLKHVKRAYDLNGQFNELSKLDPKGINGVRETYALVNSAGGPEKLVELQQSYAERQNQDQLWQNGDPKAFETIPPEWDKGLAKLAPQYLARIAKSDPEAYTAAILPHLMEGLRGSGFVANFNRTVEFLNHPTMTPEQKLAEVSKFFGATGQWYEKHDQLAQKFAQPASVDPKQSEFEQQRNQFEKEKQEHFWNTQINPQISTYEKSEVSRWLKPSLDKLKLDAPAQKDLEDSIRAKIGELFRADKVAFGQFQQYRNSKNPDPTRVLTFLKGAAAKYAKEATDSVVNARYGRFLDQRRAPKTGTGNTNGNGGASAAPGTKGTLKTPVIVSAKPSNMDMKRTLQMGLSYTQGFYWTPDRGVVKVVRPGADRS